MSIEDWAEQRGLPPRMLKQWTFLGEGDYEGWLGIPHPNMIGRWGVNYRNPEPNGKPKYVWEGEAGTHLYNPALLMPGQPKVIISEGEFDTMILNWVGFKAMGLSGAGKEFRASWRHLFTRSHVWVMFDNDSDKEENIGQMQANKLANKLTQAGIRVSTIVLPDEYKDVNDMFREEPAWLVDHIEQATQWHS